MSVNYPASFSGLGAWAKATNATVAEARLRFAQFVVLQAVARSPALRAVLVLKGGNALDFVWHPNRSTRDLDFSVDMDPLDDALTADRLRELLRAAVPAANPLHGVVLRVQRVEQRPPGSDRSFFAFAVSIGYALPDQRPLQARMRADEPSSQVIRLDVSMHEVVCATVDQPIGDMASLRVATVEDIVAEILRAILQQAIRDRYRPQDLLDLACLVREQVPLDYLQIGTFLRRKADARSVPVTRAAFDAPETVERLRLDYAGLEATTRGVFIPFDDALLALRSLLDRLELPDE